RSRPHATGQHGAAPRYAPRASIEIVQLGDARWRLRERSTPMPDQPDTPMTPGAPSPVPPPPVFAPPVAPASSTPAPPPPPSAPAPPSAPSSGREAPAATRPRSLAVPVIAAAIVAGLLGGGAGAGIASLAFATQAAQPSGNGGSNQTITVSNPDSSDVVTAVAAKAADSVVTINVAAGRTGGSGSGIILDEEGHVLTNTHVITLEGASADGLIEVTTADGRIFSATLVGLDPIVDLAVIKIDDPASLTPIEWGDSDALE